MTDIFVYERRRDIIAERIKRERKEVLNITQDELAERITTALNLEKDMSQSTVASWENGKTIPPLDKLIVLSSIFNCDISYLLGDYPERRRDSADVCKITGLSEESSTILSNLHNWGLSSTQKTIDVLLQDASYHNIGNVNGMPYRYRSILDLIHIFLIYRGSNEKHHIFPSGKIVQSSGDGWIDSGAIELNDHVIENAVLMELQQALINLKENHYKK